MTGFREASRFCPEKVHAQSSKHGFRSSGIQGTGLGFNTSWWTKTSAGKDVEKFESLCIANENVKW